MKNQQTIVLLHSAWLGAWQWNEVKTGLEALGHRVITPDLPGHGSDTTEASLITMEHYLGCVAKILDMEKEPVILLGHSFNGITASQVAELHPTKVKALIYLAGFLLPSGGSFFKAMSQVTEGSVAVENVYLSEDGTQAFVKADAIKDAFAHDVPQEAFDQAVALMVPEPVDPLNYELSLTEENYGRIAKYYIECTVDNAIPIEIQRAMYQDHVVSSFSIESGHTPNFSQPNELVGILNLIITMSAE